MFTMKGPPGESVDVSHPVCATLGGCGGKQLVVGWKVKCKLLKEFLGRTQTAAGGVVRPGTQLCPECTGEACPPHSVYSASAGSLAGLEGQLIT